MCVIIDRKPGVTIPFDKLSIACDVNKHGYGIAFADRGKLIIEKVTKQPNDPEEVAKKLDDLKKHRVFLHLRHATVGIVSEDNQHPFVSLEHKRKPVMAFMHNGTLYGPYQPPFDDHKTSDTLLFNQKLIHPLALRVAKTVGIKGVLLDQFFQWMICKETGINSVLLFFDAFGNTLAINEDKGAKFDGWWASNSYSFNDQHQRATKTAHRGTIWHAGQVGGMNNNDPVRYGQNVTNPQSYDWQKGDRLPWQEEVEPSWMADWEDTMVAEHGGESSKRTSVPVTGIPTASLVKDDKRQSWEIEKLSKNLGAATKINTETRIMDANGPIIRSQKVERIPFIKRAGLNTLDQVGCFSEQDLIECCSNWPQASASLIVDLLFDRYQLKKENIGLKAANEKLGEEVSGMDVRISNQSKMISELRAEADKA